LVATEAEASPDEVRATNAARGANSRSGCFASHGSGANPNIERHASADQSVRDATTSRAIFGYAGTNATVLILSAAINV